MVNFGLCGAGYIGAVHASCLAASSDAALTSVFDPKTEAAARLAAEHGVHQASSSAELLDDPNIDAVIIAATTAAHGPLARAAAKAGKSFLCEKPLDCDLDAAKRTMRAVDDAGVFAGIGFNRRYDHQHSVLRSKVAAGTVGKIELMHITSRSQEPPSLDYIAQSGGMLRDKGAHFFDLACWIADARPNAIFAAGSCLVDERFAQHADIDTAAITLQFPAGNMCQLDFSRRTAYGYDEKIEVFGSQGMVESRRFEPVQVATYRHGTIEHAGLHQHWFDRAASTYGKQLEAFIEAMNNPALSFARLADGIVAEAIATAGMESLATGSSVKISYDW